MYMSPSFDNWVNPSIQLKITGAYQVEGQKAAAGFGLAAKGSFDQIFVVSPALPVPLPLNLHLKLCSLNYGFVSYTKIIIRVAFNVRTGLET